MDDIDELAGALYQHDLARVRACPLSLLLRRDACVPRLVADGTEEMCAAPLLCAIEYALDALWAHDDDRRLWTADWRPTAAVARLADAAPAYQVLDWFLGVFDDLDAPLDIVVRVGRQRATLTPLMYTLVEDTFTFRRPGNSLDVLCVLGRLLRRGVRLEPNPANRLHDAVQLSPLCFALHQAALCPGLIHMLLDAGARLAPDEVPRAVWACLANNAPPASGVLALSTLLPVYESKLFADEAEQLEAVRIWAYASVAAPETLDMLRKLGLRLTPAVRALLPHDVLQQADADLEKRRRRTLDAAGAMVRNGMSRDIRERIEELVREGVPWHEGLGPP